MVDNKNLSKISDFMDKDFVLSMKVLIYNQTIRFNYNPKNAGDWTDISQIEYSDEWKSASGLGHMTTITEFSIKPGLDLSKVDFTVDYFVNGNTPSNRIADVKKKLLVATSQLNEVTHYGETSTSKNKPELLKTNEILVQMNNFHLETSIDVKGFKSIKNGDKYTVSIIGQSIEERLRNVTGTYLKILVNNRPLTTTQETGFLKNIFPDIRIDLYAK